MSEAELWELVIACNDTGLTAIVLYLTTASSYLVAAFLVGTKLTEYQVTVVSGLFVVFAGLFTYFTIGYTIWALNFQTQTSEYADLIIRMHPITISVIGLVEFTGILGCLKFMWDVRHPKEE